MSEAVADRPVETSGGAQRLLLASGVIWFVPALIGNWIFGYHVAETYLVAALGGDYTAWTQRLFVGLVEGDAIGNAALAVHLVIAFIVTIGGPLQFVPQIRRHAPAFHRWNGRLYIFAGVLTSIAALYMTATRDTFGPDSLEIAISINGVLILVFAAMTLRYAVARNIEVHQRWALRAFIAMSGVWFLRIMYAFLAIVTRGQVPGSTSDMSGPTNLVLSFACFLLPLAVLELYFHAKRGQGAAGKLAVATLIMTAAVATSIGVFGTAMGWLGE